MTLTYFMDVEHEDNFYMTLDRWTSNKNDPYYQAACYVLALPFIFEKFKQKLPDFDTPVDWIYDYLDAEEDSKPYDLTGSMVQLGKLALNLWNGYNDFNLHHCVSSVDDRVYKCIKAAMDIRYHRLAGGY